MASIPLDDIATNGEPRKQPLMEVGTGVPKPVKPFGTVTDLFNNPDLIHRKEVIRDMIPHGCLGFLGGQSGGLKTAVVINQSFCTMRNIPFAGHKIELQGGVVIFAAEGKQSLLGRVKAARMQFECPEDEELPLQVVTDFPPLNTDEAFAGFEARLVEARDTFRQRFNLPLSLAFIDTVQAAGMIAEDKENDPATWSTLFRHLRPIAEHVGCTIILVHHYGKSASAGLRGSSDNRAGADFVLAATADRDEITGESSNRFLALTKNRDGIEGPIGALDINIVEVGKREDGSPITSITIDINTNKRKIDATRKESGSSSAFRKSLADAILDHGQKVHIDGQSSGPIVNAVSLQAVRDKFEEFYVTTVADEKKRADTLRKQFNRALENAQKTNICGAKRWAEQDWVWLLNGGHPHA